MSRLLVTSSSETGHSYSGIDGFR
eukprot:gene6654-biopygen13782